MESIVDQLLKEIDKVRYIDIVHKTTGAPYALITDKMQSDIRLAEQALANGEEDKIISSYKNLRRDIFLLRLKEGNVVLFNDGDSITEVIVELKDIFGDRIWLSNGKSVSYNTGTDKSYSIEY